MGDMGYSCITINTDHFLDIARFPPCGHFSPVSGWSCRERRIQQQAELEKFLWDNKIVDIVLLGLL